MGNIGIIADIHSNFNALTAALDILDQEEVDKILVCGDNVGYGKMPNQCCALLRSLGGRVLAVAGNHDLAACGRHHYFSSFNPGAIQAMNLTLAELDSDHMQWLSELPLTAQWGDVRIAHASFYQPETFPYMIRDCSSIDLKQNFSAMGGKLGCVGHSHVPGLLRYRHGRIIREESPCGPYRINDDQILIDVGSVGCPRTRSSLGSLVVYNQEEQSICFHTFHL